MRTVGRVACTALTNYLQYVGLAQKMAAPRHRSNGHPSTRLYSYVPSAFRAVDLRLEFFFVVGRQTSASRRMSTRSHLDRRTEKAEPFTMPV